METNNTRKTTKPTKTAKSKIQTKKNKKLTVEERRAINMSKPAGNKYVEAARRNQNSFVVYDPHFM